MVGRVPEMPDVDEPDEDADNGDDLREHITEVVKLAFEWRFLADLRADRLVNVTNRGAFSGEYDNCPGVSVDNGRTLRDELAYTGSFSNLAHTEKSMLVISCFTAFESRTTSTPL